MKEFWDSRYQAEEYVYGVQPNAFFREFIDNHPPGKLFLPGEGEGRNAVYAAAAGWEVDACDFSAEGREKALRLARERGVQINYWICDLENLDLQARRYDAIGLIFIHLDAEIRGRIHRYLGEHLKTSGMIVLEAFAKEQIRHESGGPRDLNKLYSIAELEEDFRDLRIESLYQTEVNLEEGSFHRGKADIIRLIAAREEEKRG